MPMIYRRSKRSARNNRNEKVLAGLAAAVIAGALLWLSFGDKPNATGEECVDSSMVNYYQPDIPRGDSEGFGDEYRDLLDKISDDPKTVELFTLPEAEMAFTPIYEHPAWIADKITPPVPSRSTVTVPPLPTFWLLHPGIFPGGNPGGGGGKTPCNQVPNTDSLLLILIGLAALISIRGINGK